MKKDQKSFVPKTKTENNVLLKLLLPKNMTKIWYEKVPQIFFEDGNCSAAPLCLRTQAGSLLPY